MRLALSDALPLLGRALNAAGASLRNYFGPERDAQATFELLIISLAAILVIWVFSLVAECVRYLVIRSRERANDKRARAAAQRTQEQLQLRVSQNSVARPSLEEARALALDVEVGGPRLSLAPGRCSDPLAGRGDPDAVALAFHRGAAQALRRPVAPAVPRRVRVSACRAR
jgi:hypothetical protein